MENTQQLEIVEGKKPSKLKRFFLVLLVTVLLMCGAVYGAGYVLFNGPSVYAARQAITMMREHPVLQMVPGLYLSDGEIEAMFSEVDDGGMFSVSIDGN